MRNSMLAALAAALVFSVGAQAQCNGGSCSTGGVRVSGGCNAVTCGLNGCTSGNCGTSARLQRGQPNQLTINPQTLKLEASNKTTGTVANASTCTQCQQRAQQNLIQTTQLGTAGLPIQNRAGSGCGSGGCNGGSRGCGSGGCGSGGCGKGGCGSTRGARKIVVRPARVRVVG